MAVKYIFCHYISILIFQESTSSVSRTRTKFLSAHVDLIKHHCKALTKGVDQLSATEVKRTFRGNSLLSPLLKVYGFNSIRIQLRTEINKYKDENFNSFAIDKTSPLCSSKKFSSIIQEMFKRKTIDKSDFNKVTFLHGFSLIDLLRDLPMSGYLCLGFGTIERY